MSKIFISFSLILKIANWFQNRRSKDDSNVVDLKNKNKTKKKNYPKKQQQQQQQQQPSSCLHWPNFFLDNVSITVWILELSWRN